MESAQTLAQTPLLVKVVVNPHATRSFALRFESSPKKLANLKIIMQNVADVNSILAEIKENVPRKYNFAVQFNWKNVPDIIRMDKMFQAVILQIFQSGVDNGMSDQKPRHDYKILAGRVKTHISIYGAAPDFAKYSMIKYKLKIQNYIRTVLGIPNLSDFDIDQIIAQIKNV